MAKTTQKSKPNINPFVTFFIFSLLFFIPFFISSILTTDYLERKNAVSLEEEAIHFEKVLNTNNLNSLYEKDSASFSSSSLPEDKVVVLGYHQVRNVEVSDGPKARLFITSPETFEKEIKLLSDEGYISISVTEYINYLKNKKENPIPKKSVVITFDDGYLTQYTNAFPILKKYGMKATLFLYMDCIDKYPACMTSSQIEEMTALGITVANHTLRHSFLTEQKEAVIKKEVLDNQNLLEKKFGKENVEKVLAYPYGSQNEKIKFIIQNLGYVGAVGISKGVEKDDSNIFNLHRYLMGNKTELFEELFKS
ncbi:Poly-beta-1,6-N-acetyl-D-glucosamine N-deacetylase [bioreactor metagenome]|uniref:Poly-beta-1,6-N-acetyl-D-glucosamine N-deacetylase n=1 Tax=bioreactor metagenome TaxID=1076179 RepID=A0A644UA48_9ZZZZ|nr:polysaccharide deacetylase family protein [Candidatus Elulimicrobiales bacterium]